MCDHFLICIAIQNYSTENFFSVENNISLYLHWASYIYKMLSHQYLEQCLLHLNENMNEFIIWFYSHNYPEKFSFIIFIFQKEMEVQKPRNFYWQNWVKTPRWTYPQTSPICSPYLISKRLLHHFLLFSILNIIAKSSSLSNMFQICRNTHLTKT